MSDVADAPLVGRPLDRVDAPLKVAGAARYPGEEALVGLAHGALVLSRCARGWIVSIDVGEALVVDGVLDVMTWQSTPRLHDVGHSEEWLYDADRGEDLIPLQDDRICYSGQIVAYVIAETVEAAREGAERVRVTEAPEPAIGTLEQGLGGAVYPADYHGEPLQIRRGEPDAAIGRAFASITAEYATPVEHHHPMEPLVTVAHWQDDQLTVWEPTQWLNGARKVYADTLGIDERSVRVLSRFVGGSFGAKGRSWLHGVLTAVAARRLGRPVKLVLTREQMFTLAGRRPSTLQRVAVAAEGDGALTAIIHETASETSRVSGFIEHGGKLTSALYACPNLLLRQRVAALDLSSPTHTRGPGVATGSFALESALDELAHELGMDPVELRRRNDAPVDPDSGRSWSSKHLDACYVSGMETIGWSARRQEPGSRIEDDSFVGYGMATAMYTANRIGSNVRVELRSDGSASIAVATHDIGTGTRTVLAQVAAEHLGLPFDRVTVDLGDSHLPRGPASYSSLTVASITPAIVEGVRRALDDLGHIAAQDRRSPLCGRGAVTTDDGALQADGARISFAELLKALGRDAISTTLFTQPEAERARFSFATFGAVFAKVRVDRDLGTVRLAHLAGAYDVGRVINHKLARSQLIGGIIWGVGLALTEATVIDERSARYVTRNLADYRIPVNADIPPIDVDVIDEPDEHFSATGAKGLGEISITGTAAAIANAVFNASGHRVRTLPIGPASLVSAGGPVTPTS